MLSVAKFKQATRALSTWPFKTRMWQRRKDPEQIARQGVRLCDAQATALLRCTFAGCDDRILAVVGGQISSEGAAALKTVSSGLVVPEYKDGRRVPKFRYDEHPPESIAT